MTAGEKPYPICGELIKSAAWKCSKCDKFISPIFPVGCNALWAIVGLLIIPIMLAVLAFMLSNSESQRQNAIEDRRATAEAEVERDRAQEAALQTYLDRMSELLLNEGLRTAPEDAEVPKIALARTVTALRVLDTPRQGIITQFLRQAAITKTLTLADLRGTSLSNLNLSFLSLSGANLSEAYLFVADLREVGLTGTRHDEHTQWPDGFDPDKAGAVRESASAENGA